MAKKLVITLPEEGDWAIGVSGDILVYQGLSAGDLWILEEEED
jgi:hypothetical protein